MAEGVNKAILVGNLGKDPELSYTQSGTARCRFSLATSESYSNNAGERQERTEWHNIVVWGKLAETVSKFMQKGRQVYIEGRIQNRSYDDKEGNKRYISEVNANKITFLGGRGDSGGYQGGGGGGGAPPSNDGPGGYGGGSGSSGQSGQSEQSGPDSGPSDDDIPF
jgi:single-strand DNA-binding protein